MRQALLEERTGARRAAGAPMELVSPARAREIEPGLAGDVRLAAFCPIDGYASAYLTGLAYRRALAAERVQLFEHRAGDAIEWETDGFRVRGRGLDLRATRVVLAGGVWLEPMLRWLGIELTIKVLVNQLAVTERLPPVMRTVVTIASGLLSLKQFANGTVLVGGGWQGKGNREHDTGTMIAENLLGNLTPRRLRRAGAAGGAPGARLARPRSRDGGCHAGDRVDSWHTWRLRHRQRPFRLHQRAVHGSAARRAILGRRAGATPLSHRAAAEAGPRIGQGGTSPMMLERFHGIYAANVCPMRDDGAIDEDALAGHVEGPRQGRWAEGLLVNGHAGENFALDRAESRRVIEIGREATRERLLLVAGINAEDSREAAARAGDAEAAGADAIMVFPPYSWALGHDLRMVLTHHRMVADATGLPLFLFQAAVGAGRMAYACRRPRRRCSSCRRSSAIKEGSWETAAYEATRRLVKDRATGGRGHGLGRRAPLHLLRARQRGQLG